MTDERGAAGDGLNSEQREAVNAEPGRHYLVLAGAGCGKTTVLTNRIARRAACGVPLSRILALTFTRKAADEMAERVAARTREFAASGQPVITTFHAFALKILAERVRGASNFSRIGFPETPECLDEKQRCALLARCTTPEERSMLGIDILALESAIEKLNVFPEWAEKISSERAGLLLDIEKRFKALKQSEGVWDFSDLIDGVVTLFERLPEIGAEYRDRYLELLVDEFQDTNPVQIRLLKLLLGGEHGRYLFAVGDDDQAIYGFRGADIRPTLTFAEMFPGARIIKLQTNYRSVPAILDRANRIFRQKEAAYRKMLVSGRYPQRSGQAPSFHRFETQEQMADWMLAAAVRCSAELGVPVNRMAALFRINQTADWLADYLNKAGTAPDAQPQLLTVHKSKGLEFPAVFLCDMEESVFPSYREIKQRRIRTVNDLFGYVLKRRNASIECDWDEEQRLFYVAVTRAQLRLFFCTVQTKLVYGRKRKFRPSRFLQLVR
jgi:superfamily I DNA/RNA helicase